MSFSTGMNRCISQYLSSPSQEGRDEAFDGLVQWLAASYEAEGKSEQEIDRMDLESFASDLIERARNG